MIHICSEIKCGKCGCKYCGNCYAWCGCPQCGFGRPVITSTNTTKEWENEKLLTSFDVKENGTYHSEKEDKEL